MAFIVSITFRIAKTGLNFPGENLDVSIIFDGSLGDTLLQVAPPLSGMQVSIGFLSWKA